MKTRSKVAFLSAALTVAATSAFAMFSGASNPNAPKYDYYASLYKLTIPAISMFLQIQLMNMSNRQLYIK